MKMGNKSDLFINHSLHQSTSGDESTRCYIMIDKSSGEGEVIVEKTISERMPLKDIKKAEFIYEQLTDTTGGLKVFKIKHLLEFIGRKLRSEND